MPFAAIRDLHVHYEIRGRGPRLLCIGGSGWDLRHSPNIFETSIARDFEVLAYDQRGMGQTSAPDVDCTMTDYAADAHALLNLLGWDRCHVLGISFGGMVAQELALRYPAYIERLVLACTSSGGAGGASYPLHTLAELTREEYARRIVALGDTRRDQAWQAQNTAVFEAMVKQTRTRLQAGQQDRTGARRQLEARAQHDTYDRLPNLRMPVFVCGGRYDGIALPANLEALAARVPGARLELFDGGHNFFLQDKRACLRISAFLLDSLND